MKEENGMTATPVEPIVSPFYDRDGITIYNADCRDVLPQLGKFDLLLTDPPYGIGSRLANGGTEHAKGFGSLVNSDAGEWDVKISMELMNEIRGKASGQIIWGGNFYALPPCDMPICWDKVRPNQKNLSEWEYGWTSFTGRARLFSYCGNGGFVAKDYRVHPTQKPLALMKWCIGLVPEAKSVLDPFMGSGTTLVAAKLLGLRAVGIEINREYCEAAVQRLRQGVLGFDSEG